ncbi:hypothetical protein EJV47_23820 [Hymenobacter gummosus]|uniref:Uncharacterized protein n=1 Tax=Hymenobacter gummosus TaxID=1776032 RepID=A0A3S0J6G3_9BACT|nr:hypothetical protein [Hymenobacter gummosus]RTQ45861.1 hypothetical protein EJV47_23820 [Hymenobacter gummosus]
MRYREPEKKTYYARDIFRDLSSARPALAKLKGKGKLYDELIDVLLNLGEEDPYPASKDLQQRLGLSSGRLKKLIDELHEDFTTGIREDATLLQFPLVEHHFYVKGYNDSVSFNCQLPVTPRVGEELGLPFVGVFLEGRCYVTEVKYLLDNGKVTVDVWARVGSYNEHREYLRARGEFEGTLRWDNKFQHDFTTDEQLKKIYH